MRLAFHAETRTTAEHTENCFSQFRRAGSFTRRPRSNAPRKPLPPRPAEDAEPGAAISPPDPKKRDFGLWMERNRALVQAARPGRQFSARSAFVRVSA